MAVETVEGEQATIRFDSGRCIHSRHCVMAQPGVFRANVVGEWINPDAADPEALAAVAVNCPSGAIQVTRKDGKAETAPNANRIIIRENGPLAVHADLQIKGQAAEFRATLCRCGLSKNKPYCDSSHVGAFVATGEPASQPSTLAIIELIGPVEITPFPNGPLGVKGAIEISSGTGRAVNRVTQTTLCRCGHSANKPYCDGSHKKAGFEAP
jgi:CDGSH-type Zn-finger protein/ferredoxin